MQRDPFERELNRCPDGFTVWSIFKADTKYFQPRGSAGRGGGIDPKREDYTYGRFAWIMDPEGNRIELWEPPRHS